MSAAGGRRHKTAGDRNLAVVPVQRRHYAASLANWTGSMIDGSSFSGLLTRVEIGQIHMRPAGKERIRSRGSGSSLSHRV
jgi:hypothetical protein